VGVHSSASEDFETVCSTERLYSTWGNAIALLVWLAASAVAFLPFASDTSPWDALTLRVPGNQGNWWHFLAAAPFFLAFPTTWLHLRALFSSQLSTARGRKMIWSAPVYRSRDSGRGVSILAASRGNQRLAAFLSLEPGLWHSSRMRRDSGTTTPTVLANSSVSCGPHHRLSCQCVVVSGRL